MFSRFIWLLLLIVFALFSVFFGSNSWLAYTSNHWPTTDGLVVTFYGTPNFRYSVAGATYIDSHVSCNELVEGYSPIKYSATYATKYPLNARVVVHYCPGKPALAVLETVFDPACLIYVAIFSLMSLLCMAGIIFGWQIRFRLGKSQFN
jgi:hypothetical protein